jgi:3-hydroxyisobutyrate dehydrogenase
VLTIYLQENIITVLPEPSHVRTVYKQILEQNNLLTATPIKKERLFIDCSTIDPMTSADVAAQAHSSGQGRFVDAPMSGGVVGAAAGQLTFMLGAEEDIVARVTEILSLMGKRVVHLGPPTSGLKGKLANNYLLALNNIATCEAMNMGVKWGLDPAKLTDMINTATGKCWPSDANTPIPNVNPNSSRDYEGGFGTALMLKDLRLALQAAKESDVSPFLGEKARELYTAVAEDSKCGGQRDFSVVYRYLGGKE